jgi:hypothetical protein
MPKNRPVSGAVTEKMTSSLQSHVPLTSATAADFDAKGRDGPSAGANGSWRSLQPAATRASATHERRCAFDMVPYLLKSDEWTAKRPPEPVRPRRSCPRRKRPVTSSCEDAQRMGANRTFQSACLEVARRENARAPRLTGATDIDKGDTKRAYDECSS